MSQKKKKDNNIYVEYITLLLKVVLDKGYILHKVAKNMKEQGLDDQLIQKVTGLDLETIKNL